MKACHLDILWPYGPSSPRKPSQVEVFVDLDDGTRWVSSFFDTHHYNQGVKGFRGLGTDQPWRHGTRLVIVSEMTEEAIRQAVEGLIASDAFGEAFEKVGDTPPEEADASESAD